MAVGIEFDRSWYFEHYISLYLFSNLSFIFFAVLVHFKTDRLQHFNQFEQ